MTWRENIASTPMSVARAVRIAESSGGASARREAWGGDHRLAADVVRRGGGDRGVLGEVGRGAGGPAAPGGGGGEVRDDVHRVGRRAAVAERKEPAPPRERSAQLGRGRQER